MRYGVVIIINRNGRTVVGNRTFEERTLWALKGVNEKIVAVALSIGVPWLQCKEVDGSEE